MYTEGSIILKSIGQLEIERMSVEMNLLFFMMYADSIMIVLNNCFKF
jgi:hypothetical protein